MVGSGLLISAPEDISPGSVLNADTFVQEFEVRDAMSTSFDLWTPLIVI